MNEIEIKFNLESPQNKNTNIIISVENNLEINLNYKFIIGFDGTWTNLKDFSNESSATWIPDQEGTYIIMVQAREEGSTKPFDYISKTEYTIGESNVRLIKNTYLEKSILNVGEKLIVTAEANRSPVMFRFWIKEDSWQLAKDYSVDNVLKWSVKKPGYKEVMVECKHLDSRQNCDDSEIIKFEVRENKKVEIKDFVCLTSDMLVDFELDFKVEAEYDENRIIIYKFVKIDSQGETICIQDYSTKKLVSYTEKVSGDYKLLCMAKDMYSTDEYDDRAILNYKIKPYNSIYIQSFITDLNSPQVSGTDILLKAVIKGGKNVLFRFIIDGNHAEDSGYSRNNTYNWRPKKAGKYKITLWVKDALYEGIYEDSKTLDFEIDEVSREPVKINEVILDKGDKIIVGEPVNIKTIAVGGIDMRYSFILKKEGETIEEINYGACNWADFIPNEKGNYELEVKVKDKHSIREFDAHHKVFLQVYDYIPAEIDYILLPLKQYYLLGDPVILDVIIRNTSDVLIKYSLYINESRVEETDFVENKKYSFTPSYPGKYRVEVYAKNKNSDKEFDNKKEVVIRAKETIPVTNTKIASDKNKIKCNQPVIFSVTSEGGKDLLYEFYIWDSKDWILVQRFSKKSNYSFIPFVKGNYKILVLCKNQFANSFYEDYDIFEFNAEG